MGYCGRKCKEMVGEGEEMSAKLTKDEEMAIEDILLKVAEKIIEIVNQNIETAYHDGWRDGEWETVERLKVK